MNQWRPFQELTPPEVAFLERHELASETIEVCCQVGKTSFSVVEKTSAGYHWGHFSCDGTHRDSGVEVSRERARQMALKVQRLWVHRCAAAGEADCPGYCKPAPRP